MLGMKCLFERNQLATGVNCSSFLVAIPALILVSHEYVIGHCQF